MNKPEELVKALRFCGKHECITCTCDIAECSQMVYSAADQIEHDQKEIAELREKVPQWISVEDRMPDTVPCDAGHGPLRCRDGIQRGGGCLDKWQQSDDCCMGRN